MITMIISCKELIFYERRFYKVAACTPEIQVADVDFNVDKIISQLEKCREEGVKVAVFPELLYNRLYLSGLVLSERFA